MSSKHIAPGLLLTWLCAACAAWGGVPRVPQAPRDAGSLDGLRLAAGGPVDPGAGRPRPTEAFNKAAGNKKPVVRTGDPVKPSVKAETKGPKEAFNDAAKPPPEPPGKGGGKADPPPTPTGPSPPYKPKFKPPVP